MYKYVFPHVFLLSGAPTSLTSGVTHSPCTTLPAGPSKVTPSSATSLDPSASRATTLLKRSSAFFFQKSPSVHLLTIWSTSAGGTSKPKCYRSAGHTRHWSLYNGNVLQVSKIYLLNTSPLKCDKSEQINHKYCLPRFNSIRASPIYGYWKGEDEKLKLVCYKKRETVEECLDFWGLVEPELL